MPPAIRPNEDEARTAADAHVAARSAEWKLALAVVPGSLRRHARCWSFSYQSQAWIASGDARDMVVGQGPVLLMDDGRVLAGGSLQPHPEDVLRHFGEPD